MKYLTLSALMLISLANSVTAQQTTTRSDGTVVTTSSFRFQIATIAGWQMETSESGEFILVPNDIRAGIESFSIDELDGEYDSIEGDRTKSKIDLLMKQISEDYSLEGDFKFAFEDGDKTYRVFVFFWTDSSGKELATDFYLLHAGSKIVFGKATTLRTTRRERFQQVLAMMDTLKVED